MNVQFFLKYYSKRHRATNAPENPPLPADTLIPSFLQFPAAALESSSLGIFSCTVLAASTPCPELIQNIHLQGLFHFGEEPAVVCCQSVNEVEEDTVLCLSGNLPFLWTAPSSGSHCVFDHALWRQSGKGSSRAAPERDRNGGTSLFKAQGCVSRQVNGNVSFTVLF